MFRSRSRAAPIYSRWCVKKVSSAYFPQLCVTCSHVICRWGAAERISTVRSLVGRRAAEIEMGNIQLIAYHFEYTHSLTQRLYKSNLRLASRASAYPS